MRIAVFSDLHVEFKQPLNVECEGADVIVLAGDCHVRDGIVRLAAELRDTYQVPVITVAGNHEFYKGEYFTTIELLRTRAKAEQVHFLECESVVIGDTRFLGCTLWSNFCLYGKASQAALQKAAESCIADFWAIRFIDKRFTPTHALQLFNDSYRWLHQELSKSFSGKTVVITHFAPHPTAKHAKYTADDLLSPYFISDCTELLNQFDIDLWVYGHTHNSIDLKLESGTRLVSNQRGYPNEDPRYTEFDSRKLCEV